MSVFRDRLRIAMYMASKSRALYIGVTNNRERRPFEHKDDRVEGSSKQ
jgi:predicted GIY-YIG superfamily endonuclease